MNADAHSTLPSPTVPAVDDGLRSPVGIRWLLLVGALVVGVSVVGLTAAKWGALPLWAQFLALVSGALAIYAAGDAARHRLGLPVAGSGLLFLFAALVPLLAWGASYLGLLATAGGWLVFGAGLLRHHGLAVGLDRPGIPRQPLLPLRAVGGTPPALRDARGGGIFHRVILRAPPAPPAPRAGALLARSGPGASLEYRREIVLQQFRVWGQELRSWA